MYVYPLCVGPLHFTSTQSINPEIVFTLHIIGGPPRGVLQAVFPAVHSGMPVPHIRVVDTLFDSLQRGTLTHTDIRTLWWGYPTQRPPSKDPPRLSCFWRRRLLAFSLFFCRRVPSHCASMLLTLDHWTKIDSTAAAAAFQLFLFYPLFHSIPHSLYQFAFTYFFTFLHSPIIASLLKHLLVTLALSLLGTQHTPFGTCVLCYFCCCTTRRRRRRSPPPARSLLASQVAKVQSGWHHQQLLHDDVQIDSRVGCSMKLLPSLEQVKSTCPSALRDLHSLVWSDTFEGALPSPFRAVKFQQQFLTSHFAPL